MRTEPRHPRSTAFLLAQIGAHAAARFAERMKQVQLSPAHSGIMRAVGTSPGMSQQALGSMLGVQPSRLVALVDELEAKELIERKDQPEDRRSYALHLTAKGRRALEAIGRVAREHDDAICAALSTEERSALSEMLRRIADDQGLTPGVHPGYGARADPLTFPHEPRPR